MTFISTFAPLAGMPRNAPRMGAVHDQSTEDLVTLGQGVLDRVLEVGESIPPHVQEGGETFEDGQSLRAGKGVMIDGIGGHVLGQPIVSALVEDLLDVVREELFVLGFRH